MPARLIEIMADVGNADTLAAIAEQHKALDCRIGPPAADGTALCRILARPEQQQQLIDRLQSSLGREKSWRIAILPVDATIPEPEPGEEVARAAESAIREELYAAMARDAAIDSTFVLLVLLSTIVAAVGLIEDNVAVVIGGMLIAPLIGPNLAVAFGSVLGDRELILRSAAANAVGLVLSIAAAAAAGLALPGHYSGPELMSRTTLGYDSVALALAAGAAGALSLTTRLPSAFVGVMVAVALLPPAATLGYMLGTARFWLAAGAATLLAVNLVCVNLSAQLVFLAKGLKPRTWLERRSAQQSVTISLVAGFTLLATLLAAIYWYQAR